MNFIFAKMQSAFAEALRAAPQELVEQNFSFGRFDLRVRIGGRRSEGRETRGHECQESHCHLLSERRSASQMTR